MTMSMRLPRLTCLTCMGALAFVACASTPHRFGPADEEAVRAVLATQEDAWNRGDIEGFMAGYARSDALVFTSGGNIRRGWQETHDKFVARYGAAKDTMGHLAFAILGVQSVGADGAVVLGRWSLDGPNAGKGVFSVILERQPTGWKVIHDHTSSDPPPSPSTSTTTITSRSTGMPRGRGGVP
jgi:ketosteroid isomerase-like protein